MFQKENRLPVIHGTKWSESGVSNWLAISNASMCKIIVVFLHGGNPYKVLQFT